MSSPALWLVMNQHKIALAGAAALAVGAIAAVRKA